MARVTEKKLAACAIVALATAGVVSAQEDPEAKFLDEAVRGNVAEVKMGELAQQRGQSEAVRDFGEMLVEHHSKALKESAELAEDLKVIPPAQPSAEQTRKLESLGRLSGAEFDRQFASEMVKAHEEAIAKYEKHAQSNTGDAKVREHAEEALPTLKQHLAMAEQLQHGGAH